MESAKNIVNYSTTKSVNSIKEQIIFLRVLIILIVILTLIQASLIFLSDKFPIKTRYINNAITFLWIPVFFILYYWQIKKPLRVILSFFVFFIAIIVMSSIYFTILKVIGFIILIVILSMLKNVEKKNLNGVLDQK
jgi:hypothetical protein